MQREQGFQLSSTDDMAFFDRVKRVLDDRQTYDEFLKLLNLYSKDIKDGGRLRDCTGLVYDAALSDMMEDVKSYLLNALNNRTGGMDPSAEVHTNNAPQKRKAGRSDL